MRLGKPSHELKAGGWRHKNLEQLMANCQSSVTFFVTISGLWQSGKQHLTRARRSPMTRCFGRPERQREIEVHDRCHRWSFEKILS